jgi:hypothetical protein
MRCIRSGGQARMQFEAAAKGRMQRPGTVRYGGSSTHLKGGRYRGKGGRPCGTRAQHAVPLRGKGNGTRLRDASASARQARLRDASASARQTRLRDASASARQARLRDEPASARQARLDESAPKNRTEPKKRTSARRAERQAVNGL